MPAFSHTYLYSIKDNLRTLHRRMKIATRKTITHEDYLNLFVPAHQRDLFRDIAPFISHNDSWTENCLWNDVRLTFDVNKSATGALPPRPRLPLLQLDAPVELVEGITKWADNGGNVSREVGRVSRVLDVLNDRCSRAQMRFVWPSLLTLLNFNPHNEELRAVARDLHGIKAITPPALPHGVRQAIRKSNETVAMMSLLPSDLDDRKRGEVTIHADEGAEYDEPGIGRFTGSYT